ncbi:hypothetical protein [Methylibium sp.]
MQNAYVERFNSRFRNNECLSRYWLATLNRRKLRSAARSTRRW